MALMDAGIPLHEHVAGVSVGLVSEIDPSTGTIKDYRILTDILVRVLLGFFVLSSALWLSVQNSFWYCCFLNLNSEDFQKPIETFTSSSFEEYVHIFCHKLLFN